MNAVLGPLKIIATANFADVHSPVLLSMLLTTADGTLLTNPVDATWPTGLAEQCPAMCTLQEMHRLIVWCPHTPATLWLCMADLVDRYLPRVGFSYAGTQTANQLTSYTRTDKGACSN